MKKGLLLICIFVLLLFTQSAFATPYYLTVTNEPGVGPSDGSVIYATVNLSVSGNTASFTVDANQAYLIPGTNFGIQNFFFNASIVLSATDFTLPTGWDVKFVDQNAGGGFGKFGVENETTGSFRKDPLSFSVTNAAISSESQFYVANLEGYHYAAHIAGFLPLGGKDSAKFADGTTTTPVPEPATMLLLGSGLIGLAGFGRKKFRKG